MPEPGYVAPAGSSDDEGADEAAATTAGAPTGQQGPSGAAIPKRTRKATEPASPRERDARLPSVATVLKKVDRNGNERARCTIVEGGVEYAGAIYKSRSGAAMAAAKDLGLTIRTQNGFVFWGLSKPPRPLADPLAALDRAWQRYRERAAAATKAACDEERLNVYQRSTSTSPPSASSLPRLLDRLGLLATAPRPAVHGGEGSRCWHSTGMRVASKPSTAFPSIDHERSSTVRRRSPAHRAHRWQRRSPMVQDETTEPRTRPTPTCAMVRSRHNSRVHRIGTVSRRPWCPCARRASSGRRRADDPPVVP